MPVAWFIAPYKRDTSARRPTRYCAMDDFTAQIQADNGLSTVDIGNGRAAIRVGDVLFWRESECLGDCAVVKVRASSATLDAINATAGFIRIPPRFTDLGTTLGDLTAGERTAILNKLEALGYTANEVKSALGGTVGAWRSKTLGQLLRFVLTRRLRPRYDEPTDSFILDGPVDPTVPVETIDAAVP